jgi:hypothetical protein
VGDRHTGSRLQECQRVAITRHVDHQNDAGGGTRVEGGHAGVPLRLPVLLSGCEEFLYILKAGPAGGRLRRPSSRRQRHGGHRGTGLTLHATVSQSSRSSAQLGTPGACSRDNNGQSRSPTVHSARRLTWANATRLTRHAVYGL